MPNTPMPTRRWWETEASFQRRMNTWQNARADAEARARHYGSLGAFTPNDPAENSLNRARQNRYATIRDDDDASSSAAATLTMLNMAELANALDSTPSCPDCSSSDTSSSSDSFSGGGGDFGGGGSSGDF